MKTSHRIAAIAVREARRFADLAAERAGREAEPIRDSRPTFRPLTDSETKALLGGELLAAFIGHAPPCAGPKQNPPKRKVRV